MKDRIRIVSVVGAIFVFGFFLATGFITYQSQINLQQSRDLTAETSEKLMQLRLVMSSLKDCETGQRGYLITGDENYLEPYQKCRSMVADLVNKLEVLIDGDAEDHKQVGEIRQLTVLRLIQLRQVIEVRRSDGFEAARKVVITNAGKKTMDHIRSIIAGMENKQQTILDRRLRNLANEFALCRLFSTIFIGMAFLFLTGMSILINHLAASREKEIARLAAILSTAAEGIVSISEEGIIESANDAAYRIFHYQPKTMIGKKANVILPELEQIMGERVLIESESAFGAVNTETVGLRGDGSKMPIEIAYTTVSLGNKKVTTGIIRDVTEKKEIDRRVSEFYSTVSHELRTPLTSIRGSLSLMDGGRAGDLSPRAQQLVKVARSESERLIRLINDILDIKKIESGKLELSLNYYDVNELVQESLEGMRGLADQAQVKLSSKVEALGKLYCDKDRIEQVLTNLLSNAVKFSPPDGEVLIKVEETQENAYRFSISDNGPGIHPNDTHKLFGLFQQLDPSDSRRKGGTGLGLAISKALIDKHHGIINVDSQVGKGSTFWFELPSPEISLPSLSGTYKATLLHKRESTVLIVEDDTNLSGLLAMMLRDQHFIAAVASSIKEAENYLKNNSNPDVIILDLTLPDGDGLELMDKLHHDHKTAEIPVVIVSGREPEMGGYSHPLLIDWIKKPFDESRLLSALSLAIQKRPVGRARVLLVEDDQSTREVVKQNLEPLNVDFIEAEDGITAVHFARSKNPDLIVLDLSIPSMDGFEVVQLLKKENIQIPLIVYTARDLTDSDKRELTLGLTAHLIKSRASEEQLLETVKKMLNGMLDRTKIVV